MPWTKIGMHTYILNDKNKKKTTKFATTIYNNSPALASDLLVGTAITMLL